MRNGGVFREGASGCRPALLAGLIAAAVLGTAAGAEAATNLVQRPLPGGCITESPPEGHCQNGRGVVGPADIALSPDGRNAYVASSGQDSVAVLSRNPADGALAPVAHISGCFYSSDVINNECTKARELDGARAAAVSPDGENVYVAAPENDAVVVFDRDPATGALSLSAGEDGCVTKAGINSCAEGKALELASDVVVSPDGKNVYVVSAGGQEGGIAVFDRDPEDGDLTQDLGNEGCIAHYDGVFPCELGPIPLLGARALAISPDGAFLYVVSPTEDALTIYSRDPATGDLTWVGAPGDCFMNKDTAGEAKHGCIPSIALGAPKGLALSAGGESLYVAAEWSDAIAVFDRDPSTGDLAQKPGSAGCVSDRGVWDPVSDSTPGDCQDGLALNGVSSVAVLPNGGSVYGTTAVSDGVIVFERMPNGELAQRPGSDGCITETGVEDPFLPWTVGVCSDGTALMEGAGMAVSADSENVYTAASGGGGGIGIFDVVDAPPPPPPPLPPPPPPPPAPYDPTPCAEARKQEQKLGRALPRTRRRMRSQIKKARRADDPAVEKRLRRAVRRSRKRTRVLRRALLRVERRALSACYRR